jgi:hypothetical protein
MISMFAGGLAVGLSAVRCPGGLPDYHCPHCSHRCQAPRFGDETLDIGIAEPPGILRSLDFDDFQNALQCGEIRGVRV